MSATARALWYIETRFERPLTLGGVARAAGISRFHMARLFEARIGLPVMAYVRGRRLSEAAHRLAGGAPDILAVALQAGYASHEAFTRAFVLAFGTTPEAVRRRGDVAGPRLRTQLAPE